MSKYTEGQLVDVFLKPEKTAEGTAYCCGLCGVAGELCHSTDKPTKELIWEHNYKKRRRIEHLNNTHPEWRLVATFIKNMCKNCNALIAKPDSKKRPRQSTLFDLTVSRASLLSQTPSMNRLSRAVTLQAVRSGISLHAIMNSGWQGLFYEFTGMPLATRWSAARHLKTMADEKFVQTKETLKSVPHMSLAADIWTADDRRSFMAIIAVYLDDQFCMKTSLIDFVEMPISHTADAIRTTLKQVCSSAGIDPAKKVVALVTDSASNNLAAVKLWRQELGLQAGSRGGGEVTLGLGHVPCVAHMLHNAVNDALETPELSDILSPVRTIVNAFRNSSLLSEKLKAAQVGNPLRLISDVKHRWHYVYKMLERFLNLREAIKLAIRNSKEIISSRQDAQVLQALDTPDGEVLFDRISSILQVFSVVQHEALPLEPHLVPTQHAVIVSFVNLLRQLKCFTSKEDQDPICQEVARRIYQGVVRRFEKHEMQSALMSLLLEPRAYSTASAEEAILRMLLPDISLHGGFKDKFVALCCKLYRTYKPEVPVVSSGPFDDDDDLLDDTSDHGVSPEQNHAWAMDETTNDPAAEEEKLTEFKRQLILDIDRYLMHRKAQERPAKYHLLKFFSKYGNQMNVLGKIARMLLCVPATSAVVERFFSRAGWMLSPRRSRMSSETFRHIMHIGYDSGNMQDFSFSELDFDEGNDLMTETCEIDLLTNQYLLDIDASE